MANQVAQLKPLRMEHEAATLSNGLRVVVHGDRTSPIVAVHLMYRAGSRDERSGRTGLAHLLEHLLFEGSENCPKGEFDRLLERVGGTNNGSTWLDRTNYYEVVPKHAVELALWLERERMGHFLPVLDEEMLEVQRSVVINERKQVYENRPYGLAHERLQSLLFPPEHPYSWPTIGYTADLQAITLSDAREFYRCYYAPDNAVLVLAGDIGASEGFELADRYFGDLEASSTPRPRLNGAPPRSAAEEDVLPDRVSFPRVYEAAAVAPYGSPDWISLDVLSYLLADGESSRLQRTLIRELQLVQDIDTYLYPTQLAGIFGIVATARSGVSGERVQEEIERVLESVGRAGEITEEEVAGSVRRARRDHINSLATVEERAEELAYAETVLGGAGHLEEVLNGYAAVTVERVREAAERYLGRPARAVLTVVPDGREHDETE
jgi:zinc protease